ncbi:MAG: hypothetical protein AAB719_01470 [Patescibacteria group bacterium]
MKIVSSGKVLHSSKFYKKKKRKKIALLIFFLFLISSITYGLVYFLREERFQVSEVSVLGENVIDRDEITLVAENLLTGFYLFVVPRSNFILYPRRTIERALVTEFPRLSSATLDLKERTLYISVEERLPHALYCREVIISQETGKCYFLDEEGLIFAPAPSFSGNSYFVYATEKAFSEPVGERLMNVEEFKAFSKFREDIKDLNVDSVALEIGEDDYQIFLSSGGKIIWQKDNELSQIFANLNAFLSDDSIRAQKDFLDRILYLNLSSENKVFYKFK